MRASDAKKKSACAHGHDKMDNVYFAYKTQTNVRLYISTVLN
jgi:hypothetical protein